MTIDENLQSFAGRPVVDWRAGQPAPDPELAVRVKVDLWSSPEGKAEELFLPKLEDAVEYLGDDLQALVVGAWGIMFDNDAGPVVKWLAKNAARLPALEALFVGDLMVEESEMSWIEQCDITPLLRSYPRLRTLGIRGSAGLWLSALEHTSLHTLVIETGGLPGAVVRAVTASSFPALTHLELWLGHDAFGNTVGVTDLQPIFDGCFDLRVLGLRNAVNQDDVAEAVAGSAVLDRLDTLDLSLGNLTDRGAEALLTSARILGLTRLDLHHHYLTRAMMDRLLALPLTVDVSDPQEPDQHADGIGSRPIAVSE